MKVKLRLVYPGDFRQSEASLLQEALKEFPDLKLGPEDCVMLVATSGKLAVFASGFRDMDLVTAKAGHSRVIFSSKVRICDGGRIDPRMIVNLAEQVGLEIVGLKRFESYYRELRAERQSEAAE